MNVSKAALKGFRFSELHRLHDQFLAGDLPRNDAVNGKYATALDLKIEIGERILDRCDLCEHRCDTKRSAGQHGFCKLGSELNVAAYTKLYNEGDWVGQPHLVSTCGVALCGVGFVTVKVISFQRKRRSSAARTCRRVRSGCETRRAVMAFSWWESRRKFGGDITNITADQVESTNRLEFGSLPDATRIGLTKGRGRHLAARL